MFFALTFLFSWLLWLPGVLVTLNVVDWVIDYSVYVVLNVAGGAIPSILGLCFIFRTGGRDALKEALWSGIDVRRIKRFWWVIILFMMPIIHVTALLLGILAGSAVPELTYLQQWWLIPVLFIVGFIPISNAFREEFGWRGYAIDPLQSRFNALVTSAIIGLAWGLWHLPLWYFPTGVQQYASMPFWGFLSNTVMLSIIMTWLYNNTNRSILSAVAFHVVINISPQIFPFAQTDIGIYFNIILNICLALAIVIRYGHGELKRTYMDS